MWIKANDTVRVMTGEDRGTDLVTAACSGNHCPRRKATTAGPLYLDNTHGGWQPITDLCDHREAEQKKCNGDGQRAVIVGSDAHDLLPNHRRNGAEAKGPKQGVKVDVIKYRSGQWKT